MIREGNEWMGTLISLPCTLRTNFPPLCSLYRLEKERRIKSDRVWWQVILGENKLLTQALLLIHVPSPILETLLRLNFKRGHWQVEYSAAILSIYQTGVDWQVLIANKHMLKFPPTNKCCCRTICAFCKVKNLFKKKATNKQKKGSKATDLDFFFAPQAVAQSNPEISWCRYSSWQRLRHQSWTSGHFGGSELCREMWF